MPLLPMQLDAASGTSQQQLLLWDHLPLGSALVDLSGTIRFANARLAELAGFTTDELVGKSVFDFVDPDDLQTFVGGFVRGTDFRETILGPLYVRFRDRFDDVRPTECWAYSTPPALGIDGYIVTLAPESMSSLLAAATRAIAAGVEVTDALAAIAASLRGYPVNALGSMLVVDDAGAISVVGEWPLPETPPGATTELPWNRVASGAGAAAEWRTDALPQRVAQQARERGLRAVWLQPVDVAGRRRGVLVAWRQANQSRTPNQIRHLDEAAAAAVLAFAAGDHQAELERAALEDHLTGVGNRAALARQMTGSSFVRRALLFIDVDRFKEVNDTFGHHTGDEVLRIVATRLRGLTREGDMVYRLGGDEFVIVCEPHDDVAAARRRGEEVAQRVVDVLGRPAAVRDLDVRIGASVGMAVGSDQASLAEVLAEADVALMTAKRCGRGRWIAAPMS